MTYKALLFDLDDTLIDFKHSEKVALEALHAAHFRQHIKDDLTAFKRRYSDINHALWEMVNLGHLKPEILRFERFHQLLTTYALDHDINDLVDYYEQHLSEHAHWYENAEQTLNDLKEHYAIGIITNGLTDVQLAKYQRTGLATWCDCFLISEQFGAAKPDQSIFHAALDQLGHTAEDTLMIGDSLASDFLGARNANLDFCWIRHDTAQEHPSPAPKYTISTVNELDEILA